MVRSVWRKNLSFPTTQVPTVQTMIKDQAKREGIPAIPMPCKQRHHRNRRDRRCEPCEALLQKTCGCETDLRHRPVWYAIHSQSLKAGNAWKIRSGSATHRSGEGICKPIASGRLLIAPNRSDQETAACVCRMSYSR